MGAVRGGIHAVMVLDVMAAGGVGGGGGGGGVRVRREGVRGGGGRWRATRVVHHLRDQNKKHRDWEIDRYKRSANAWSRMQGATWRLNDCMTNRLNEELAPRWDWRSIQVTSCLRLYSLAFVHSNA